MNEQLCAITMSFLAETLLKSLMAVTQLMLSMIRLLRRLIVQFQIWLEGTI